MSRHKFVKALNLDDELDDFDGGAESENDEVSIEDKEHLRLGTIKIRDVLGLEFPASEKEIEDALWYYYYDIEKTVNYLIGQKTVSQPKKPKIKKANYESHKTEKMNLRCLGAIPAQMELANTSTSCGGHFSVSEFFRDSPWLNIPEHRLGDILIEPLYPRGGLLGGASSQINAPKSKLAALAAARRTKENHKPGDGQTANAVALLDKLGGRPREHEIDAQMNTPSKAPRALIMKDRDGTTQVQNTSVRQSKEVNNSQKQGLPSRSKASQDSSSESKSQSKTRSTSSADPSSFAQIISGAPFRGPKPAFHYLPHYAVQNTEWHTKFDFAEPSPDDIVTKAQSARGKASKEPMQQSKNETSNKSVNGVAQAIENVSIEDTKIRGKNLDVLAEFKKSKPKNAANFVVIGHVDAGKSTLMGRLLYDLKVVDKRTLDRYRKEAERLGKSSFALAWVLDQGTEERERGVTIDIAMNKFETESTSFTILDAPGHRDFIPNMIAGASQADFAVLVIDASTGNFESGLKGQTKEHALLVRSMGVQRIVIVVNKCDTVNWSKDRFEEISQQISAFLTSAGFQAKNLSFVPCAGLTGDNIIRKIDDPQASWYTGPPLISLLESSDPVTRALEKPFRLTIDDIFRGGVQNPLSVSGRLDAGSIQTGDAVLVMPANQTAAIRGLEVDSEPADWAVAGQNLILHLANIEAKYLRAGDVICSPAAPIPCVTSFNVKVLAFEHITPMHCEVHKGRLHAPGRIKKLIAELDKGTGLAVKGKKPRLIKPGSVARVGVEVEDAIPLERGARVILRAGGETMGAGLME